MMRRFLLMAVVALGALPVAADATHKPGHQGGGPGTLSIAAKPNPVVYGRTVAVSGRLNGKNTAGKTVQLEADAFPYEGSFQTVGSALTNSRGEYALTHKPLVNTRYRARQGPSLSVVVTELVRIRVSLRLSDRTPRRGQRVRFFGRACPEHDGATVRIQRRTRTGWRTVRRTVLRDLAGSTCSRYSKRFRVFRDGTYRTVVASPHADHASGVSRRRRIDVH